MAGSYRARGRAAELDWPAFVPAILACGFAVLNMLLPLGGPNVPVGLMLMGVLFVQPVLFAIWMVLGPGAAVRRIPITLASFVIVMLAGVFNLWNLLEQRGARDAFFVIPGLALLTSTAAPLCVIRWQTGWRIGLSPGSTRDSFQSNQYSLKFLLGWMTICALLIVVLQGLVFKGRVLLDGQSLIRMAVSLALILLLLLPAGCIPLVVLSRLPRGRILLASPLLWGGLLWLTIEMMLVVAAKFGMMPDDRERVTWFVTSAQAGAVMAALAAALALRIAGFRLSSRRGIMAVVDHSVRSPGATTVAAAKPLYGKKEFAQRGEAIYTRDIEPQLTNVSENDFVAIDIETGHYEIDADEAAAADRLLARIPNAQIWVRRVGSPYVRRFGPTRTEIS